jgi:uncharacterized protein YjeT (DUF2065 family)
MITGRLSVALVALVLLVSGVALVLTPSMAREFEAEERT